MYRLFLALRYLRSRFVNLISVGGVMFGVAVLIAVSSVMDGFQERMRATIRGNLSHLILIPAPRPGAPKGWMPPFAELEKKLMAADSRIVAASPQISMPMAYPYKSLRLSWSRGKNRMLHQMNAIGIDWEREAKVSDIRKNLVAGNAKDPLFNAKARKNEITTVLVGRTFADKFLHLDELTYEPYIRGMLKDQDDNPLNRIEMQYATVEELPGGEFKMTANTATPMVTGIVDGKDTATGARTMYFDIRKLRELGGFKEEYLEVRIRLQDYEDAAAVREVLRHHGAKKDPVTGKVVSTTFMHFEVETWEDQRAEFLQTVEYEKIMLMVILSFIVLLGGFIILATLTLTVVEKTRDIGILGALGAQRGGILSVFLWNGLLIGVIGSLLGMALGWWFVENVDVVRSFLTWLTGRDPVPSNIYHFREVPTIWSWPWVLQIAAGSICVSFLAALIPAMRAARMDPIKALRHE